MAKRYLTKDDGSTVEAITITEYATRAKMPRGTVVTRIHLGYLQSQKVDGLHLISVQDLPSGKAPGQTVKGFSEALGVSPATVHRMIKRGQVQAVQEYGIRYITTNPSAVNVGPPTEGVLTSQQFADATGVGLRTVHRWVSQGKVRHVRHGVAIYIYDDPEDFRGRSPLVKALPMKDFARDCGVAYSTVAAWVSNGKVESVLRHRRRFITSNPKHHAPASRQGMTMDQFAVFVGVNNMTVQRWITHGKIPAVMLADGTWDVRISPADCREPAGMTTREYASACGITETSVRQWIRAGQVETIEGIGGRRLITSPPRKPAKHTRAAHEGPGMLARDWAEATGAAAVTVRKWIGLGRLETTTCPKGRTVILTGVDFGKRMLFEGQMKMPIAS
ncbi:hypothetical protein LG293_17935 (plasmid) [Citricoccus nitrophenolicus]